MERIYEVCKKFEDPMKFIIVRSSCYKLLYIVKIFFKIPQTNIKNIYLKTKVMNSR